MHGEIARGAFWMVLFRLVDRSIGVISTALLARLLLPNDFGLVAMAMSVIAIIELATAFSFDLALIQMRDPRREHYDTAWSMNLVLAAGGALVTALACWPAASFFGDPRLTAVMLAIAGGWLVSGFENIGPVNFRREMNFSAEFRMLAMKRLIAFFATLLAAFTMGSYWALIIGSSTGRVVGVVLSFAMHPFRPRLDFSRVRDLMSFSGWMFVNSVLGVVFGRVPHFVVGRTFGAQPLGAYTVAAEFALLAQTELIAPINRAMFPGYARLVSDFPLFRRTCIDATTAILLIAIPVSVGIAVLAGPFVRLLLGPRWGEAVPILQILAASAAVQAISSNNTSIYYALGRPRLVTLTLVTRLLALAVGIGLTRNSLGVSGIAWSELAATLTGFAVSLPVLLSVLRIGVGEYLAGFWRPVAASAVMAGVILYGVQPRFDPGAPGLAAAQLFGGTAIGMVVYPLTIALLWSFNRSQDAMEARMFRLLVGRLRGMLARGRA